jgi:hypothetical protein
MSHPNPLYDEENTMSYDSFDDAAERSIWPWVDDESHEVDDVNYDDFDDFHDGEDYDDSMDGDHESGLASAGWGTDEDYGYYGDYNEDY